MDERPAWRPRIFVSEEGPSQGLPELFPEPTHLKRKERSKGNRGALYVPSAGGGAGAGVRGRGEDGRGGGGGGGYPLGQNNHQHHQQMQQQGYREGYMWGGPRYGR